MILGAIAAVGCAGSGYFSAPAFSPPPDRGPASPLMIANVEPVIAPSPSLWRSGPQSLFGDRRARAAGDIVTVLVEIDDKAELKNRTDQNREGSQSLDIPTFFGLESLAARALPGASGLSPAIEASSGMTASGDGAIKREEKIEVRIAATVVGVQANGYLVIRGDQEVRVNHELRALSVSGVIRPEDINRTNIITYDKIADARIDYGGRGQVSDLQRARAPHKIIDAISPF
jgi:flagellar L-ring protein precursor FlgH